MKAKLAIALALAALLGSLAGCGEVEDGMVSDAPTAPVHSTLPTASPAHTSDTPVDPPLTAQDTMTTAPSMSAMD